SVGLEEEVEAEPGGALRLDEDAGASPERGREVGTVAYGAIDAGVAGCFAIVLGVLDQVVDETSRDERRSASLDAQGDGETIGEIENALCDCLEIESG